MWYASGAKNSSTAWFEDSGAAYFSFQGIGDQAFSAHEVIFLGWDKVTAPLQPNRALAILTSHLHWSEAQFASQLQEHTLRVINNYNFCQISSRTKNEYRTNNGLGPGIALHKSSLMEFLTAICNT